MFSILLSFPQKHSGSMEAPEHVWFLMARNLSGEATPEEQQALMDMLRQHPEWMQQYDVLQTMWPSGAAQSSPGNEQENVRRILQRAAEQESLPEDEPYITPVRRLRWGRVVLRAAIMVGIAWAVWTWAPWRSHLPEKPAYQEIIAQKGSKTRAILPDGSTVWLNAGSRLVYPTYFSDENRQVTLQGEAYFDVVKQTGKPFIVHAGDIDITVLGTAFNVRSYSEDKTIETTLIRGLVQITRPGDTSQAPILLRPNQKVVLHKNGIEQAPTSGSDIKSPSVGKQKPLVRLTWVDSSRKENEWLETAWIYNRLEFRGEQFSELGPRLERWYNITVHFEDDAVMQLTFNGSLENETVDQAFQALRAAAPFRYEIKGNEVFVRGE